MHKWQENWQNKTIVSLRFNSIRFRIKKNSHININHCFRQQKMTNNENNIKIENLTHKSLFSTAKNGQIMKNMYSKYIVKNTLLNLIEININLKYFLFVLFS